MGAGVHADECVGEYDPAHDIIREPLLDRGAERLLEHVSPNRRAGRVVDRLLQVFSTGERVEHRRRDHLCYRPKLPVELLPCGKVGARSGEPGKRLSGGGANLTIHQQPVVSDRSVGRRLPRSDGQVESEVAHDPVRQEADQV